MGTATRVESGLQCPLEERRQNTREQQLLQVAKQARLVGFRLAVAKDSPAIWTLQHLPNPDGVTILALRQAPHKGWRQHIQGLSHNAPTSIWLTYA